MAWYMVVPLDSRSEPLRAVYTDADNAQHIRALKAYADAASYGGTQSSQKPKLLRFDGSTWQDISAMG
jgi:hypothetical protein